MPVEHGLAILILIGRLGDVLSTHFVTPTMALEMNPVARRFKKPTFVLGFLLCAVPYFDVPLGVMAAVPSLLVSAWNLSRAWMARTIGEKEMERLIVQTAKHGSLSMALWLAWTAAAFFVLSAVPLFWLVSEDDVARYFGVGLAAFGIIMAIHSTFFFVRVFRLAREGGAA